MRWVLALLAFANSALAFQPDPAQRLVDLPPGLSVPIPVTVDFFLLDVDDIDGSEETFSAELYLDLKWTDSRLAFDAAEFGAERAIYPGDRATEQLSQIWSPAIDVVNLVGSPETIDQCLTIYDDGTVEFEWRITGSFSSAMELSRYPVDQQSLEVRIESFLWNSSEMQLVTRRHDVEERPHVNETLDLRGWNLVSFGMKVEDHRYVTDDTYSSFVSTMVVRRDPWFCIWAVIFPLVLVTFFALTCFFWDQEVLSERVALAMYGMLTVAAQSLLVSDELPKISYFTRVDYAFFLTYAVLCAVAMLSVVAKLINQRDPALADRVDMRSAWVVSLGYVFGMIAIFAF